MKHAGFLSVRVVQNGFVVSEDSANAQAGKTWAFESAVALSEFMLKWGRAASMERDYSSNVDGGYESDKIPAHILDALRGADK